MSRLWRFIEKHDPVIGKKSKHRFAISVVIANVAGSVIAFSEAVSWVEYAWVFQFAPIFGFVAAVYYDVHLRCPTCAKAVWFNSIGIGQLRVSFWTPWVPDICTRCGNSVD